MNNIFCFYGDLFIMKRFIKSFFALSLSVVMAFSFYAANESFEASAATLESIIRSVSKSFTGIKKIKGDKYYFVKGKKVTGLRKVNGKKYYFTSSGAALKNKFKTVKGKKYYFTASSAAKVGILNLKSAGKRYYFNKSGVMKTGIIKYNGKKYYFAPKGKKVTGFVKVNNKKYYVTASGKLYTGFKTVNGKKYYLGSNGVMYIGYKKIGSDFYYFDANGAMKTGFVKINGSQYYFDANGHMRTGFTWVGDKLYYIEGSGEIYNPTSYKGWVKSGDTKCFYTQNGVLLKNTIFNLYGKYYAFDSNGYMYNSGFTNLYGATYYFEPETGAAAIGWNEIDGDKYYFDSVGRMAYGMSIINDHLYSFSDSGVLDNAGTITYSDKTYTQLSDGSITSIWYNRGSDTYYFDSNGLMVRKNTVIDGVKYYFSSDGTLLVKKVTRKGIDVSKWNGDIDWKKVKAAGVSFAMIRIGYEYTLDPYFKKNIEEAKAAGVYVGVYIYSYAETVKEAEKEADFVIKNLKGYKLEYPVAFDIEDSVQNVLSNTLRSNMVAAFCDKMEAAGYYTTVYSSKSWLENKFNTGKIGKYDKWVAQWPYDDKAFTMNDELDKSKCTYKADYGMWQYTSSGKVNGISGRVDMNYSYTDYPSLMKKLGYNNY